MGITFGITRENIISAFIFYIVITWLSNHGYIDSSLAKDTITQFMRFI